MKRLKKAFLLIILLSNANVFSQSIKILNVGDECPDFEFTDIINYNKPESKLSDFKGKLLILDFWATWCSPCIAFFPKAEVLQKQFENQIQILPVTYQDKETVSRFLQKMNKVKHLLPPSITGNTNLKQYFKHAFIPHYVWIKNMKIVAITSSDEVTERNIAGIINNSISFLPTKKDPDRINVNQEKGPVFTVANPIIENNSIKYLPVSEGSIFYHSTLLRYNEGFPGIAYVDSSRITLLNTSIAALYRMAAGKGDFYGGSFRFLNRTIIESDLELAKKIDYNSLFDQERMNAKRDDYQKWALENAFCYEISISPLISAEKKFDIMLNELNSYFGLIYNISGSIEKRRSKCLVLLRTTSEDNMAAVTNQKSASPQYDKFTLYISNKHISVLLNFLRQPMQHLPPLIDETGYTGNIDIVINATLSDVNAVNEELKKYGLKFIEAEREIDMLVIKKKNRSSDFY